MNSTQFTNLIQTSFPHLASQSKPAKHLIFHQGDPATHFYLILSGSLKLTQLAEQGYQNIIELIKDNELIGTETFDQNSHYKISAQTVTATKYLIIPRSQFIKLINQNSALSLYLINHFRHKLWRIVQKNQDLSIKGAQQRITEYLLQKNHQPLTHQEISELLGSTRETVSKIASRLKKLPQQTNSSQQN